MARKSNRNKENVVTDPTTTQEMPDFDEVDVPAEQDDEREEVAGQTEAAPKEKKTKAPARPPVPEGFIAPVAFAKLLTQHLVEKGELEEGQEVKPQVVYSYIKNNGPESKNPLPTYSEGGRDNLLKVDEALAWWDAKSERVAARKANAAEKAAKKAANAKASEDEAPAESTGVVEEAE